MRRYRAHGMGVESISGRKQDTRFVRKRNGSLPELGPIWKKFQQIKQLSIFSTPIKWPKIYSIHSESLNFSQVICHSYQEQNNNKRSIELLEEYRASRIVIYLSRHYNLSLSLPCKTLFSTKLKRFVFIFWVTVSWFMFFSW